MYVGQYIYSDSKTIACIIACIPGGRAIWFVQSVIHKEHEMFVSDVAKYMFGIRKT